MKMKDGYCIVPDCENASAPGSLYCRFHHLLNEEDYEQAD